jgi:hypothetical protein
MEQIIVFGENSGEYHHQHNLKELALLLLAIESRS